MALHAALLDIFGWKNPLPLIKGDDIMVQHTKVTAKIVGSPRDSYYNKRHI